MFPTRKVPKILLFSPSDVQNSCVPPKSQEPPLVVKNDTSLRLTKSPVQIGLKFGIKQSLLLYQRLVRDEKLREVSVSHFPPDNYTDVIENCQ